MRVFVTGATGFIGSVTVAELVGAGHEVVGLARSQEGADALQAAGAKARPGDLYDLDTLREEASAAEGVIHLAYMHQTPDPDIAAAADRQAITTLGQALAGSGRALVITSGTALLPSGRLVTERDSYNPASPPMSRSISEQVALSLVELEVRVSLMRLPPSVHGRGDHGFVPRLIALARQNGVSAYVGEGQNRWPAVHRLDAATAYRLALEKAVPGEIFHAIDDQGVAFREIAEVIGRHLQVPAKSITPDEVESHFGPFGRFASIDNFASSAITTERLGWLPTQVGLIADLEEGHYFTE